MHRQQDHRHSCPSPMALREHSRSRCQCCVCPSLLDRTCQHLHTLVPAVLDPLNRRWSSDRSNGYPRTRYWARKQSQYRTISGQYVASSRDSVSCFHFHTIDRYSSAALGGGETSHCSDSMRSPRQNPCNCQCSYRVVIAIRAHYNVRFVLE